jgi:undecaprenyl-diphosphatase
MPIHSQHQSGKSVRVLQWIGSRELPVLVVLFAILCSLWGFAELTENVLTQETHEFDRALLLSMRNADDLADPLGPRWLEEVGRDITALGGNAVLTLLTLAVVGYLLLENKPRLAVVILIATLGALGTNHLLKNVIDRDRPDLVPHGSFVYTASFPSGHSMLAASTYLTLGALLARAQRQRRLKAYILLVAIFTTLLVGISRVYLGVHWPTDVLAGWTAGSGWALMCWLLARWLQQRGDIEEPTTPTLDRPQ